MLVKMKVFEMCDGKYKNLSELARTMGISVSQIYRVRQGKRRINQKFLIGAIKAFPGQKFDDLFYFIPELSAVTNDGHHLRITAKPIVTKKQKAGYF